MIVKPRKNVEAMESLGENSMEHRVGLSSMKWRNLALTFGFCFMVAVIFIIILLALYFCGPLSQTSAMLNTPITETTIVTFDLQKKDISENLRFISRIEWGAEPPTEPLTKLQHPVPYVVISNTATDFCNTQSECMYRVRFAQTFHIESRGWSDIAYNFLVGGDGFAYVGRNWDYVGAHSYNYNTKSIGISFIGTFNTVVPPERQLQAAQQLIELGVKTGMIAADYKLLAHRQISSTLSPGDALYNVLKTWPHWSPEP